MTAHQDPNIRLSQARCLANSDKQLLKDAPPQLTASVVTYGPDRTLLRRTLHALLQAQADLESVSLGRLQLHLIDNTPAGSLQSVAAWVNNSGLACQLHHGHGNIGYGRGHNLAIAAAQSHFHLILNPDLELGAGSLTHAIRFMNEHPEAGLVVGDGFDAAGHRSHLCKRYPTVLDLLLRGFGSARLKARFQARLDRYEMRDLIGHQRVVWDPPIVSGCFMLFRTHVLQQLGGFDPSFFLYFEDFDLSIRARTVTRVAYVPAVRFTHHGGDAAKKGMRHIRHFGASAFRFYNKHGWRWLTSEHGP